jgi:hypothetical protein
VTKGIPGSFRDDQPSVEDSLEGYNRPSVQDQLDAVSSRARRYLAFLWELEYMFPFIVIITDTSDSEEHPRLL